MSQPKPIQLGLCCLNITLRESKPTVFCSRKMIIRSVIQRGIDALKQKILENLDDVIKMMTWNENNGIRVFRLSSELFPHKSNPKVDDYTFDFAIESMKKIGEYANKLNHRLTFHPGQYNVIGTPNKDVFLQTACDLKYHADVLDYMGLNENSVMVIHGGGIYNDKEKTIERWVKQFHELPENVKGRLVLENCEKCFSIKDCLMISEKTNIPVVFDTHHYECYNILHKEEKLEPPEYYIPLILETWKKRGMKVKFHVSEQGDGKVGHHSDYIQEIPNYLLEIPEKYGVEIDIMIEAKMKELAIFKLYEKYPELDCKIKDTSSGEIIEEKNINKNKYDTNCCENIKKKRKKKRLVIVG